MHKYSLNTVPLVAQKCHELKIGREWENVRRMGHIFLPYYSLGVLRHCSNQDNQLDGPLAWLLNINCDSDSFIYNMSIYNYEYL